MTNGAFVYVQYSYVILSVQQCYTIGAAVLYYWCSSAALLVSGCCTVGTRALHFSGTNCFTGKY